jgi:hypothetical protein
MTLAYTVETLEGLDEGVKALYAEGDKGFTLNVSGVVPEAKFNEINQQAVDAKTEAARRRKTLERVTGKLGLESADGLDDALEALMAKKPGKPDADQEAIVKQLKESHANELKASTDKIKAIQLDGAKATLQSNLQSVGFPDEAAKMFAAASIGRVQIEDDGSRRILSETGTPLAGSGADGFATELDLAKELAAAMPNLLVDNGKGGGAKSPASSGKATAKTMTREAVDKMSQAERSSFFSSGGKIA